MPTRRRSGSAAVKLKFVRVTRLGHDKFREEKLDVLGWHGERLMTLEPPAANQMDCYVLPGNKLWPVEESDQDAAEKAQKAVDARRRGGRRS
jgi:hypothetical protein